MWQHFLSVLSAISLVVPVAVPLCNSSAHTRPLSCAVKLNVCEHTRNSDMVAVNVMCHRESSAREARAKILVYIYIYICMHNMRSESVPVVNAAEL